jgi:hypothetical protein
LARAASDPRWLHVSARGLTADSVVDYFRVKFEVDEVVRASGIPWVLLQPTAFMEVWVDLILATAMREKGTAMLFGDGNQRANYIAIDDVAHVAVAILERPEVRNEAIEIGGPSNVSMRTSSTSSNVRDGDHGEAEDGLMAVHARPPAAAPFNGCARMMTFGALPPGAMRRSAAYSCRVAA